VNSKVIPCVLALLLSACGGSSETPARAPAPPLDETAAEPAQPANPAFIGRVWISTTPGSARGSIIVFLPDRTLLMDSCFETFRVSRWGVAGDHIRWLEDSIPIEAEVQLPSKDELALKIVGQNRAQTYVAVSPPYVCPEMPR
jgi:hypothetical protein